MKGDKFTADNPVPARGKRTFRDGTPFPDELFENESTPAAVAESERISEKQIAKEEKAIDKLLAGDDSALDDLDY